MKKCFEISTKVYISNHYITKCDDYSMNSNYYLGKVALR